MSNYVLVLDTNQRPLDPVHPAAARKLLSQQKAAVFRRYPFTIILKEVSCAEPQPLQLKIDPGSKTTGIVILSNHKVIWAAEITHRGWQIKAALLSRSQCRRARRQRKTRYRKPGSPKWRRRKGWLPPSLQHRVETTLTWVNRLRKFAPIAGISQELVRFDTQAMQNPEISGAEYQQGELAGYEVREYLLEKWDRKCAYCEAENVPLEVEHIVPRSKGGSNRVSNLTIACRPCNERKGNRAVEAFLKKKPDVLKQILAQAKAPLRDAAAVNSTRWALFRRLKQTGLPVETGTGGRTKYNRRRLNLPKTHWLDAACVGAVEHLEICTNRPLLIRCVGHGTRQRAVVDKHGFPKQYRGRFKFSHGFKLGDIVDARIPTGKYAGIHKGLRVAIRKRPSFALYPKNGGKPFDAHCKYLTAIHRADGYSFSFETGNSPDA